jgi:hypothetical protein
MLAGRAFLLMAQRRAGDRMKKKSHKNKIPYNRIGVWGIATMNKMFIT